MDKACVFLLLLVVSVVKASDIGLSIDVMVLRGEMAALQRQVLLLQAENQAKKVAFAVSLVPSGEQTFGPNSDEHTLVYTHVIANIGNAYNSDTGIFTAPVKGVYHFQIYALSKTGTLGVRLKKNAENVNMAYENQPSGDFTAANAATLSLEVGDTVYVTLTGGRIVYDNENHHNTFCGHLLFTL